MRTILAADIGCTNSRFAWFQSDPDANLSLQDGIWLPTRSAKSFAQLLEQLQDKRFPLAVESADIAAIAVACPVERIVASAKALLEK